MIVDDIAKMLFSKKRKLMLEKDYTPLFAIYIDVDLWRDMMSELSGEVSNISFEVYRTMGKMIYGAPVHKVLTRGHGVKIFEITEIQKLSYVDY